MEEKTPQEFPLRQDNFKWLLIAIAFIVVGFVLMIGGGSEDPNVFKEDEIFSFRRITLAPILCLIGYALVIYAIIKEPGKSAAED